jgi:tryptophan-rich sensory protein
MGCSKPRFASSLSLLARSAYRLKPTLSALFLCVAAAALESALAGSGVRRRLAELRMPPYSPPFSVWLLIGLVYYVICFVVLRHLLASVATVSERISLALLFVLLLGNAFWNVLFFRRRDLRASFIALMAYSVVVVALVVLLSSSYPRGAALFICYCLYLLYATWWGYRLWRLNTPHA